MLTIFEISFKFRPLAAIKFKMADSSRQISESGGIDNPHRRRSAEERPNVDGEVEARASSEATPPSSVESPSSSSGHISSSIQEVSRRRRVRNISVQNQIERVERSNAASEETPVSIVSRELLSSPNVTTANGPPILQRQPSISRVQQRPTRPMGLRKIIESPSAPPSPRQQRPSGLRDMIESPSDPPSPRQQRPLGLRDMIESPPDPPSPRQQRPIGLREMIESPSAPLPPRFMYGESRSEGHRMAARVTAFSNRPLVSMPVTSSVINPLTDASVGSSIRPPLLIPTSTNRPSSSFPTTPNISASQTVQFSSTRPAAFLSSFSKLKTPMMSTNKSFAANLTRPQSPVPFSRKQQSTLVSLASIRPFNTSTSSTSQVQSSATRSTSSEFSFNRPVTPYSATGHPTPPSMLRLPAFASSSTSSSLPPAFSLPKYSPAPAPCSKRSLQNGSP